MEGFPVGIQGVAGLGHPVLPARQAGRLAQLSWVRGADAVGPRRPNLIAPHTLRAMSMLRPRVSVGEAPAVGDSPAVGDAAAVLWWLSEAAYASPPDRRKCGPGCQHDPGSPG